MWEMFIGVAQKYHSVLFEAAELNGNEKTERICTQKLKYYELTLFTFGYTA